PMPRDASRPAADRGRASSHYAADQTSRAGRRRQMASLPRRVGHRIPADPLHPGLRRGVAPHSRRSLTMADAALDTLNLRPEAPDSWLDHGFEPIYRLSWRDYQEVQLAALKFHFAKV